MLRAFPLVSLPDKNPEIGRKPDETQDAGGNEQQNEGHRLGGAK